MNDLQFQLEMTPREPLRDCDVALILFGFFRPPKTPIQAQVIK
jgi:hypothetical protein